MSVLPAAPEAGATSAELALVAQRFPDDLKVAMATAQSLRAGSPNPPLPTQEPWPPMQVPS
jgi:hypothetical protein